MGIQRTAGNLNATGKPPATPRDAASQTTKTTPTQATGENAVTPATDSFERVDLARKGNAVAQAVAPERSLSARERHALGNAAANLFRGIACRPLQLANLSSSEREALAREMAELREALPSLSDDRDGQRLLEQLTALMAAYAAPGSPFGAKAKDAARDIIAQKRGSVGQELHLGDFQNQLVRLARQRCPALLEDLLKTLPEVNLELKALERTTGRLAAAHGKPLTNFNVVVIGHLLGDAPAYFAALEQVGLDKATTRVLAVPYSSNELAIEALRQRGYDADNPQGAELYGWGQTLDIASGNEELAARARLFAAGKEESVATTLGKALQDHAQNGRPILVLDDGGYALKVIKKRFAEHLSLFRFVEQTTRGIRMIEEVGSSGRPVIDVAQSHPKTAIEGPFIADDLIQAMVRAIRSLADAGLSGARIGVIGYGTIGKSVARELMNAGAQVTVWDTNPEVLATARADGMSVADEPKDVLAGKQIVAGCTGSTSIDPAAFLYLDPHTTLVSTSSMDVEFRGAGTNAQALQEIQYRGASALSAPRPTHAAPRGLQVSATVDAPGSSLYGTSLSRDDLWQNKVSRAAVESLEKSLAGFSGRVAVKMSVTEEVPRGLARALDIMAGAVTPNIDAAVPPDTGWRQRIADATVTGRSKSCPVHLANGGYPVNFDRAIQGMAPERIQITRATMVAAAVQVAILDPTVEQDSPIPLDATFQDWIEKDFRDLAPTEYAFAMKAHA